MSSVISRYLSPIYLLACLTCGGASAAGYLANGVLQLLALGIIVFLVLTNAVPALSASARQLLLIVAAVAGLLVLQLIPLPAGIWSLLPGRQEAAQGYALVGISPPWLPLSLAPERTVEVLISILPPLAMVLLTFSSSGYGRLYSIYVALAFALVSILFGVFQHIQGPDSPYYIYDITNRGGVVAFFANRNHLSTFLLSTLPFLAALAITPSRKTDSDKKLGRRMISGCMLMFVAVGVIVVKSVAGWMLLAPVLIACLLIFQRGEQGKLSIGFVQATVVATILATGLALFAPIQLNDLGDKLSGVGPHERNESISTTARASLDYLPFGSGAGSFRYIYPQYEKAADASSEYVNHAHDDYVEVLLENGLPGITLLGWFVAWWLLTFRSVWRNNSAPGSFGRAAFVTVGVILAHSVVDYPVRTAAVAAIGGMAAALLVAPEPVEAPASQFRRRKRRDANRSIMIGADMDKPRPNPIDKDPASRAAGLDI